MNLKIPQDQGTAVGTARWRLLDHHTAKMERVAVLKGARGNGIGTQLMRCILDDIHCHPQIETIKVGSQKEAIPFEQKLGFQIIDQEYLDAEIPHYMIVKSNSEMFNSNFS